MFESNLVNQDDIVDFLYILFVFLEIVKIKLFWFYCIGYYAGENQMFCLCVWFFLYATQHVINMVSRPYPIF